MQTIALNELVEAFETKARRCFGKRLSRLEWTDRNPFEPSDEVPAAYLHVSLTLSDHATADDLDHVMNLAYEVEDHFDRAALIEPHVFDAADGPV